MEIFERISKLSEVIHLLTRGNPNKISDISSIELHDVLYANGLIDVIKGRISIPLIRIPVPSNNYLGVSLVSSTSKWYYSLKSSFIAFYTKRPRKPENKINLYTISMIDELYSLLVNVLNLKYQGWRDFFLKYFELKSKLSRLKLRFHVFNPKDIIEDEIGWNKINVDVQELDSINFKELPVEDVLKLAELENVKREEIENVLRESEGKDFILLKTKNLYFTLSVIEHENYRFRIVTDNPMNCLELKNFRYVRVLINLIKIFKYLVEKYPIIKNTLMFHLFESQYAKV
jgi:hypothetical protein